MLVLSLIMWLSDHKGCQEILMVIVINAMAMRPFLLKAILSVVDNQLHS